MIINNIRTLAGPNLYSHQPVLVMQLDLGELAEKESYEIPGFVERLLDLLPGLREHHCALGRPGGFVERLNGGTYFGHIVEHVALELAAPTGAAGNHGKTRYAGAPGAYNVIVEYKAEQGMRYLLKTAVELVDALVKGEQFPLEERLAEARRIVDQSELGPSTRAIVDAAERRGIPWMRLDEESLVQLGYGKNRRLIRTAMSDLTSYIAVDVASDKHLTKNLLERASLPVPRGVTVVTKEEAVAALQEVDAPVAVKPLNGHQGKGVSLDLMAPEEVAAAFDIAREFSDAVVVEEYITGRNYRVLVVGGKMVAASERLPAHVVGDGSHTIAELVDIVNQDPRRGEGHENVLTRIRVDPIVRAYLEKSGRSLTDVPAAGEMVLLRESANLSTGGTAVDVTDAVHPDNARVCQRAARIIGLDICGVDLVTPDIRRPIQEAGGGIVEVNAAPGLRMHLAPSMGRPREVGEAIIDMLYPPGTSGRIPIVSITGTNGKTTVARLIAHILGTTGKTVGLTTTDGIMVGGEWIARGDTTGPASARSILIDPEVYIAILETARGGIARRGLGYDWSDISVITNVQLDHVGQDMIEGIDDLVHIKSLVAERVREGGTLILNADDEHVAGMARMPRVRKIEKQLVYFSLGGNPLLMERHLAAGGTAYFVRNGWIVEAAGQARRRVVRVASVPITMDGMAEFQVANVMAAVAACRAYGLPVERIASALVTFSADRHNPGRMTLYRVGSGYVMVDYGHNPPAFEAVCRMAARWSGNRVTAVVGVPGDRADSVIEQAGRSAAQGFERIIIREDEDLRGRAPGETAGLLQRAIQREAPECACRVILDEHEAIVTALREMESEELVVIFYDELEPVLEILREHAAVPVSRAEEVTSQLLAVV